jgi:hypothetical protein
MLAFVNRHLHVPAPGRELDRIIEQVRDGLEE